MATDLLDRCGEVVPLDLQEMGYELADLGDVELFRAGESTKFYGLVFDPKHKKEPPLVTITWSKNSRAALMVACSCGHIQSWQGCGHVWAALVMMSRKGYGSTIPGGAPLHLVCSPLGKNDQAELGPRLAALSKDPRAQQLQVKVPAPPPRHFFETPRYPPEPVKKSPPSSPGAVDQAAELLRRALSSLGQQLVPPPPLPPPPPPRQAKPASQVKPAKSAAPPLPPDWRQQLTMVIPPPSQREPRKPRRLYYSLGSFSGYERTWNLEFWQQEQLMAGGWGVLKPASLVSNELADLPPLERQLVRRLFDAHREAWAQPAEEPQRSRLVAVPRHLLPLLLPALAATGRFGKADAVKKKFTLYEWDAGGPWRLTIEGSEAQEGSLSLRGRLRREEQELPLSRRIALMPGGLFRHGQRLAELDADTDERWLQALQNAPEIVVPAAEVPEALTRLAQAPASPAVELDRKWNERITEQKPAPALRLELRAGGGAVPVQLLYLYGELEIPPDDPRELLFDSGKNQMFRRHRDSEKEWAARLPIELDHHGAGSLPAEIFAQVLSELAAEGWRIGTRDQKLRSGGRFAVKVESGVDWFDLGGSLDFAGEAIALPSLLQAVREGRGWVNLEDGSVGLLPPGWVRRWSALIEISRSKKDLRFGAGQALVLDNLLRHEEDVEIDEVFARIRAKLRSFDQLEPVPEPPGFRGELRPYQRLGLAWLELLAELRLGGCLADDMGLGKTVQVLAWLLRRKQAGLSAGKPSLLVVPRSLVFNWAAELRRFTPEIAFAVSHGAGRESVLEQIRDQDLLITTYGTLVRDIDKLRTLTFDTVVVDEAQAIKNRNTQAAEACAALPSELRLALTGTPVENHLGELWSIFDFLNPGLLGSLPKISQYAGRLRLPPAALAEVATALRPLILRRKKSEVLRDLPAKTEQTLVCELGPEERRRYNELRTYYQASLQKKIAEVGLDRAKLWVLEALLRLRQAACHPGLIDKKAQDAPSAKLETLLEVLEQVLEEGHKAIVFSQFTSLLALLRRQLDARGQTYEYLDGKTHDREAKVQRFQTDPELRLFLISLKAGGVGLNLTAASYVFLLDPWWNPAVESQAIDRAHRIGQQQPVFAYRIIAADTVEEKILKLQEEKRALADAIVAEDQRVLKQLTAADLQQLLG